MKTIRFLLLLAVLIPSVHAQGVARPAAAAFPVAIFGNVRNSTLTAATLKAGYVLPPSRGLRVEWLLMHVTGAATATGTATFTITDGTNTCTATVDCTSADVSTLGPKKITALTGTCSFVAGSALTLTNPTTCGTATPTVHNVDVVGTYL